MAAAESHTTDELWQALSPELRQALTAIYARAHGPYGVRLQSEVSTYITVLDDAVSAGATQSMLAHWLSQAGLRGRDGRPVQLGSLSRAMSSCAANCEPRRTVADVAGGDGAKAGS